jgi:ubiquinone/menaquinone biosynthesis C-methylase UbiE
MRQQKMSEFRQVDSSADPGYFIRFLDRASAEESFKAYKRRTFALLDLHEGHHVLEVGCGTGEDARALAQQVGRGGRVVAVDSSQAMIDEARQRALPLRLPLEFRLGDAHHLDFPDNSFDGCRSDRTFMHLHDPRQALAEMVRVARPGAWVIIFEVDFETLTVDVPDRPLGRKVMNSWCDSVRNGWLGRHIPALFREAGLRDLNVIPHTLMLTYDLAITLIGPATVESARQAGVLSEGDAASWLNYLEQARQSESFFSTLGGFIVVGRKP